MNKWIDWINKNPFAAMGIMLALASIWMQYKGTKKLASVFETHKARRKNPGRVYHTTRAQTMKGLRDKSLGRGDMKSFEKYDIMGMEHERSEDISKKLGIPNPKARGRKKAKARK